MTLTPTGRIIRTASPDKAESLIMEAMDRRLPVTVVFREIRKDDDTGKPVKIVHPETGKLVFTYVEVMRTIEFFDVGTSEKDGSTYFTGMDRVPRDRSGPGVFFDRPSIRRVRADRVTELTLHNSAYVTPNTYFINKVREHARFSGDGGYAAAVDRISDDALWEVIQYASDREEAEQIAVEALGKA